VSRGTGHVRHLAAERPREGEGSPVTVCKRGAGYVTLQRAQVTCKHCLAASDDGIPDTALAPPADWYNAPLCEVCTFPEGWCECVSARIAVELEAGSR
jgi:hypothetical protein